MSVPFGENGGIGATVSYLMIPMRDLFAGTQSVGIFDTTNFNDDSLPSSVTFKAEDVVSGRVPTVRRVMLTYRDLGQAKIVVTVFGCDDRGIPVSSTPVTKNIGNTTPTFSLYSTFIDMQFTGFRPQLQITRPANGGPVSLVQAVMIGTIERQQL